MPGLATGEIAAGRLLAARASTEVLATVSAAAARRHPADLPTAMAAYVTRVLSQTNKDPATAKTQLQ